MKIFIQGLILLHLKFGARLHCLRYLFIPRQLDRYQVFQSFQTQQSQRGPIHCLTTTHTELDHVLRTMQPVNCTSHDNAYAPLRGFILT